jgi:hypothetical protein
MKLSNELISVAVTAPARLWTVIFDLAVPVAAQNMENANIQGNSPRSGLFIFVQNYVRMKQQRTQGAHPRQWVLSSRYF